MKFFVERPVAVAMIYLALLVLGVYSFLNTPLEMAPREDYPRIDIQTSWPGVSPEIVQTHVTAPLEEVSASVKGVRRVSSESRIGASSVTLELDPKADMEFVNLALREAVAHARAKLPYGVRPSVQPFVPEDFRVNPFLSLTISGDDTLQEMRGLLKERLEFGLGTVKGVMRVDVSGGSDPEVRVVFDEGKLNALDIQPYQVNAALDERLRTYPAGRMKKSGREYLFKLMGSVRSMDDLGRTIVSRSGNVPVRLADVAEIRPAHADVLSINRINGKPTVMLTVLKEKGANTLKVAREVKRRLEAVKAALPGDLVFKIVDDESAEIGKSLDHIALLAGIVTILIFLMIFVVLRRFVPSLLILSSIAFSVVITFNLIYLLKIPLNMLTLGALALGFGMFVDNSIVVFENTLRLTERGVEPVRAALQGAREVFVPVLASTLTTIGVFFCFPYFQGRLRIYYLPLAFVMASALAASLVVSFSLIPALSPFLLKGGEGRGHKEGREGRVPGYLRFVLRHPVEIVLVSAAVLYGSYKWFRAEVSLGEFFPWYSAERLAVDIRMPPGTDIDTMDAVVRKFEAKVLESDVEKELNARVQPEDAYLSISFPAAVENSSRPYALKEELIRLATRFAGVSVGIYGFNPQGYHSSMEAGTSYDSRITFTGYSLKKLKDITAELERALRRNRRTKDVRTMSSRFGWWRPDSSEYVLRTDREALRKYDVDPRSLFFHVRTLLAGRFGAPARVLLDGKETAIVFKFPEADRMDLGRLQDTLLKTKGGESLRLREVLILEEKAVDGSIDREDQRFQQTVMWEFRGPSKAADTFKRSVFSSLKLPPGFSSSIDEEGLMTGEEKGRIAFAIALAVMIIYMVLAALYESLLQPFIILLSVPLALIGVFAAFIIAGYPFDSSAYIGVLLMAGIVVNNAILLVDHINLKRKRGLPRLEAVITGTRERIRPVLMTTATTILGMLPMLFLQVNAGRRDIWSTLALCTVGGLSSSTIFIFIIIPVFYYYGERK
jgi:HAE1 family hydrophobic/amphiphilic exporter-1